MIGDTIAAISTPLGSGGIGIVRVSGPQAYTILRRLFKRSPKTKASGDSSGSEPKLLSHRVYYGFINEPGSDNVIDEVLVTYMQGPKSFTREDIAEIHSHSGFVVLNRILSVVVDAGARLADPGEFTKRAFINGRIDLTQAEAIIDLINAPCETAAKIASEQIKGGLRGDVENMIGAMIGLQANCEAVIEFGEEEAIGDSDLLKEVKASIKQSILPQIISLIQRQIDSEVYRKGLSLTIAGMPNVGKSSLLNQLVEKETAIVSEFPGTTRDIVREYISIQGVPVVVCDTAGIHDTNDPVECIGIEKAQKEISVADIILLVVEATRELNEFEEKLLFDCKEKRTIVVINKDDIVHVTAVAAIQKRVSGMPCVRVSAKTGSGFGKLKDLIFKDVVTAPTSSGGGWVSPNLRQKKVLEKAKQEIERVLAEIEINPSPDLASDMISNILDCLYDISGSRNREDLYDHIFSQFCIGK